MLTLDDIDDTAKQIVEDEKLVDEYPPTVIGRTVHIDADFLAYFAAYERTGETKTPEDCFYQADVMLEEKRREAGAQFAVAHTTPNGSDKGGRYDVAIQKEYQGNRDGQDKPRHLDTVREYIAGLTGPNIKGKPWFNAEADDGMAEAGWQAHYAGKTDSVVICSKDKDLRMVPGLHLNWDTGTIHRERTVFGEIGITERVRTNAAGKRTVTKKHKGFGTKFFWFQMLMGDSADNIKGCPKVRGKGDKLVSCGLVAAYNMLKDATDDKDCLRIVMAAYKLNEYKHWKTGHPMLWQDAFWSDAKLLWMQRTAGDIDDVKKWVKEVIA